MNKLYCHESSQFFPKDTELKDLRSTFIASCIFNNILTYTTVMMNTVTIYALHKTSTLTKALKTLLLSLACFDVAVGLFTQPLYTFLLVKWLQVANPSCDLYQMQRISDSSFAIGSFYGVVAVSVDRFLALHLHLRYQELVTHKRVVIVVISVWVYSTFVSLMIFWVSPRVQDLTTLVAAAFVFILTLVMYIRIYLIFRRHKNHIQSIQIRDEAQSHEIKKFAVLIKSTVGIFYVYLVFLVCCLPWFICMAAIRIFGSSIVLKKLLLFSYPLFYLNSSLNPVVYCWKMRHIRHVIINILRKISRSSNRPFRVYYNRSSSVVHVDN